MLYLFPRVSDSYVQNMSIFPPIISLANKKIAESLTSSNCKIIIYIKSTNSKSYGRFIEIFDEYFDHFWEIFQLFCTLFIEKLVNFVLN